MTAAADIDRLYALLPTVHRRRDGESGEPLRALLQVIAEQLLVVEDDIAGLYDDWFIETCAPWVIPYLGDLVGHRGGTAAGAAAARRQVANLVRRRRAKGTRAGIEGAAEDAAGWPVLASESFRRLAAAQSLNHLRLDRHRILHVGDAQPLERLGGPFDESTWLAGAPAVDGARTRSRWGVPSVALFAWRLRAQPLTLVPAGSLDRARHRYTFSLLGHDTQLFSPAGDPDAGSPPLDESDVPHPIARRAFDARLSSFYGPGRSLRIFVGSDREPVPAGAIVAADLSRWAYRPREAEVAVDPVRGRISFPTKGAPRDGVWVSFHHGTVDDLGGGEYRRALSPLGTRKRYGVGRGEAHTTIAQALAAWEADRDADPAACDALIEIVDGEAYTESPVLRLHPGDRLELRAAQSVRPAVRLLDLYANQADPLRVEGLERDPKEPVPDTPCPDPLPRLVLDGLLVTGRSVEISGRVGDVVVRHCTLVPGWSLDQDCRPQCEEEPSIELRSPTARLCVEHSICGTIVVDLDPATRVPARVSIHDSVIDAANRRLDAICAPDERHAFADLEVARSTILGRVLVHAILRGEDSIFADGLHVVRRQLGCVRYSYVPPGCRTPPRYRCQPDLAIAAAEAEIRDAGVTDLALAERLERAAALRVRPQFDSTRYGTPAYARLALTCAAEIRRGAADEGEMGVYHDLYAAAGEENLRAVLDDFLPASMAGGVFFAT